MQTNKQIDVNLTCLHEITINRMVKFMIRAINDRTVSGTV